MAYCTRAKNLLITPSIYPAARPSYYLNGCKHQHTFRALHYTRRVGLQNKLHPVHPVHWGVVHCMHVSLYSESLFRASMFRRLLALSSKCFKDVPDIICLLSANHRSPLCFFVRNHLTTNAAIVSVVDSYVIPTRVALPRIFISFRLPPLKTYYLFTGLGYELTHRPWLTT